MLAMVVNDNAGLLAKRGALESIASMLAPTRLYGKGRCFCSMVSHLNWINPVKLQSFLSWA
ncbi:hypothetical protein ASE98_09675 [Pseudomonas sp. Leaf48]|nr:hypothetical protein ASE98_09675 [Pseudomonas sp. Leaf48]